MKRAIRMFERASVRTARTQAAKGVLHQFLANYEASSESVAPVWTPEVQADTTPGRTRPTHEQIDKNRKKVLGGLVGAIACVAGTILYLNATKDTAAAAPIEKVAVTSEIPVVPVVAEVPPTTIETTTTTTAAPTTTTTELVRARVEAQASSASPYEVEVWSQLAECESSGRWDANTGNGYYGGLQFSLDSWQYVGGTGYPHEASQQEQIARGEILLDRQGWGAWPQCSIELGLR